MMRISSRSTTATSSNNDLEHTMFGDAVEEDKKDCVQSDLSDATGTSWNKHPIIKKKETY